MEAQPKLTNAEWSILKSLRSIFLSETQPPRTTTYWDAERLRLYDLTFAKRIEWKWQAVLNQIHRRWSPPSNFHLLDFGCGTGAAAWTFLKYLQPMKPTSVLLSDRVPSAELYAERKLKAVYPDVEIRKFQLDTQLEPNTVLLLSHLLNELFDKDFEKLVSLVQQAHTVFWVEPGTPTVFRRMVDAREACRKTFVMLSPCPHQSSCGLLTVENLSHWCHHFATPPQEVFHSAFWSDFSKKMGIDLRSLPLSHLVMTRGAGIVPESTCIVGKPRFYNEHTKALVCQKSGVAELTVRKSKTPELFESLNKKGFILSIDLGPT